MARRNNGFGETEAARHRIEKIDIYEVTKEEIEELCSNSTSDLCLEFAIASVSIFASFLCSLLVADFSSSPMASSAGIAEGYSRAYLFRKCCGGL